jgi:hypothetical protein
VVHPDNRDMAVRAAKAIGLDVCGVDFITADVSESYRDVGGGICEVNAAPGLRMHLEPSSGSAQPVGEAIIDAKGGERQYARANTGLGLVLGFLTPIALIFSILLNLLYFVLMVHDWAEQGQNLMMVLAAVVAFATHSWAVFSIDHLLHLFGA